MLKSYHIYTVVFLILVAAVVVVQYWNSNLSKPQYERRYQLMKISLDTGEMEKVENALLPFPELTFRCIVNGSLLVVQNSDKHNDLEDYSYTQYAILDLETKEVDVKSGIEDLPFDLPTIYMSESVASKPLSIQKIYKKIYESHGYHTAFFNKTLQVTRIDDEVVEKIKVFNDDTYAALVYTLDEESTFNKNDYGNEMVFKKNGAYIEVGTIHTGKTKIYKYTLDKVDWANSAFDSKGKNLYFIYNGNETEWYSSNRGLLNTVDNYN